ncbi:hypothetical protein Ahy_B08g093833 isoform A [Arachis hypogaea]|uniref:Uncharacterized protein n=2 Tax=Arachis hypogaea TaxID=3818 RepID=A0A444Y761_ARAHY|nr:hypothetical protein Ahy_B08g093833 isoform A [Arachis hypogaea]
MKIVTHLITVIHLCAIASNTVFNLAHLLAVASNAVVAAFSKLLQFGFAISITSNRIETMTEQQRSDISNLGKSTAMERLAGRGLFMDPPSVFMSNNMWSLLLPEGFQIENLKLGNISKFQIPTLIPFLFRISSYSFLTFSQPLLHDLAVVALLYSFLLFHPILPKEGTAILKKKIGPGVYNISTADDAERILTSENKVVLAFLTTLVVSGSESEELAAASKLEDNYFLKIYSPAIPLKRIFVFLMFNYLLQLVFVHVDMDDEDAGKPIASFFGITGNKISSVVLEGKGVSSSNNLLPKNKMINRILNAQNLQGKLPPELVKLPHLQEMHVINVLFEVVKTALIR